MQRDKRRVDAFDFHAFQQLTAEMKSGSRHGNSTFVACEECLEVFQIFLCRMRVHVHTLHIGILGAAVEYILRQRSLAKSEEVAFELIVRTVIEEAQGTSTAGRVVIDLGYHVAHLIEEEFVPDTDLTGRLHEHVPQVCLLVELTQDKDLNLRVGLFLRSVQTGWENLRIIEDEHIAIIEIVDDIAEVKVLAFDRLSLVILLIEFYLARCPVQHHQTGFITTGNSKRALRTIVVRILPHNAVRIKSHRLGWQLKFELR